MFQTKVTFFEGQTPEQRKAHAAYWRRTDAERRAINNGLGFWRMCRTPKCRRNHTCLGDMHACFERHWELMPEDEKEYVRGCAKAAGAGVRSPEAIDRAGQAAREDYLNRMERNAPPSTPVEPAVATAPDPVVRIRSL